MNMNDFGRIVNEEWFNTARIRPNVELFEEEFVVMPNHIHGIICLSDPGRGSLQRTPTELAPTIEQYGKPVSNSIPTIIRLFKSTTTKQIKILRQTPGVPVWQRNYYEHIIRTDKDYYNIVNYIYTNPLNWDKDDENQPG